MDSNQKKFLLIITLLLNNLLGAFANNLVADLLPKGLVDKKAALHLLQLLFTAKLMKEYQDSRGIPNDPQTNYMLFMGKGNIEFQNHELDIQNLTEPIDFETTTTSSDLAHNKHLLKFVARNGYDVWKRLLVVPYNSTAQLIEVKPTDHPITDRSDIIDNIITNTISPEVEFKTKRNKGKYEDKFVNTLKELYRPDLQMIETEKGIIKHQVKPPKWIKNIIENGSEGSRTTKTVKKVINNKYIGTDRNSLIEKVKKKAINKSGSAKSDKIFPTKYINNKNINNVVINSQKKISTVRPTQQIINKMPNKVNTKNQNNRIGNIVIKGFNGLIRGIGSMLGIYSSQQ